MIYRLVRALLFLLPAETAHHLGLWLLRALSAFPALCKALRSRALPPENLSVQIAGLTFPNPIGLAAGLDKDAVAVPGLFALGFGSVEVGTLTPRPQPGNPGPRLFRLTAHRALINRLGFNNRGAQAAAARLAAVRFRPGPLGANIGKNRDTPLDQAAEDYLRCAEVLAPHADYLVVNASSPNTPGLRDLQEPDRLEALLRALRTRLDAIAPHKAVFLKIAPDLTPEAVDQIVDVALACGVDALIATNTTVERPVKHPIAQEQGGLSGEPLREISNRIIRRAHARAGGRLPIIGVGGILSAADVYEKIRAGASLVQVYTGFIYGGPDWVRSTLVGLSALLRRDGFQNPGEAVGADATPEARAISPQSML